MIEILLWRTPLPCPSHERINEILPSTGLWATAFVEHLLCAGHKGRCKQCLPGVDRNEGAILLKLMVKGAII